MNVQLVEGLVQTILSLSDEEQHLLDEKLLGEKLKRTRNYQELRLTPAPQESGFQDTSVNHDRILAEQTFSHKLPKFESDPC